MIRKLEFKPQTNKDKVKSRNKTYWCNNTTLLHFRGDIISTDIEIKQSVIIFCELLKESVSVI